MSARERWDELRKLAVAVEKLPYEERLRANAALGRAEAATQWLDDPKTPESDVGACERIYALATKNVRTILDSTPPTRV